MKEKEVDQLPLISVITPILNQALFIEDTILSVIAQNYKKVEYIIVDGGSTDGSLDIIKSYAQKFPQMINWISEEDDGQADAINKGFKMARGEYLTWLNADDVYLKCSTLNDVIRIFLDYPSADVIYGDVVLIDRKNRLLKIQITPTFDYKRLLFGCYIKQPALFFRRKIIENYELNSSLEYAFDYEFWLRMGREYHFLHIPELWAADRNHPERKILAQRDEMYEESDRIAEWYRDEKTYRNKIFSWLDYKINVGLVTRVAGVLKLKELYMENESNNFSLPIKFPAFFHVIINQLFRKNRKLV